ncbi:MAG: hypothetical protein ACLVB5_04750 [Christensenellales bacterium]
MSKKKKVLMMVLAALIGLRFERLAAFMSFSTCRIGKLESSRLPRAGADVLN